MCELYTNHIRISTKVVNVYLIDWGAQIPQDNLELKSDAKRTSKDSLQKIFI